MAPPQKQQRDDNAKLDLTVHADEKPRTSDDGGTRDDKAAGLLRARGDDAPSAAAKDSDAARADGELASKPNELKNSLDVVRDGFHWLNDAAQAEIEQMRGSLKKEDEPSWLDRIGETVLDAALSAGAAASGVAIADVIVGEHREVLHEFVKVLFEEGIVAGVAAGRTRFGKHGEDAVDPFIESQKEGVRGMHMANQTDFTMSKRDRIKTLDEANALKAAFSNTNLKAAAHKQKDATRDAWVSYVAQSKFGSKKYGDDDTATTNMDTQEQRDRALKRNPYLEVPKEAPDAAAALTGDQPGVLTVIARLPKITADRVMHGEPHVELALLNGVNDENRKAYEDKAFKDLHIPRQLVARVEGDMANFTLNFDETGAVAQLPEESSAQAEWLVARGSLGRGMPDPRDSDFGRETQGLDALLSKLRVGEIKGKLF